MYLTVKQQVKHLSKEDYKSLRELCHIAKNLTNEAIYNVRQYYFTEGKFLKYEKNYTLIKSSPNYLKRSMAVLSHSLVYLNLQNRANTLLMIASYLNIFQKTDILHL